MKKKYSPNEVFAIYGKKKAQVSLRKLDRETIVFEGDKLTFEFLGQLFTALASSDEHSIQMSPKGAASARFKRDSKFGLYLHRLPCPGQRPGK